MSHITSSCSVHDGVLSLPSPCLLMQDCVRRMLERDPSKRATASEVLKHEWVRENGVASDVEIEPEVGTLQGTMIYLQRQCPHRLRHQSLCFVMCF